jgi:hypothetical protein
VAGRPNGLLEVFQGEIVNTWYGTDWQVLAVFGVKHSTFPRSSARARVPTSAFFPYNLSQDSESFGSHGIIHGLFDNMDYQYPLRTLIECCTWTEAWQLPVEHRLLLYLAHDVTCICLRRAPAFFLNDTTSNVQCLTTLICQLLTFSSEMKLAIVWTIQFSI